MHEIYMRLALALARQASHQGEVPVGAIVVWQGQVIGQGFNQVISLCDPSAHAEILALRSAALHQRNYRLNECVLYSTLEPCMMCLGAIFHARIAQVLFGAYDAKTGACGSALAVHNNKQLNHHTEIIGGVLAHECGKVVSSFFAQRRQKSTNTHNAT